MCPTVLSRDRLNPELFYCVTSSSPVNAPILNIAG